MYSDAYLIYDAIADIQLEREAPWRAYANCLDTPVDVFFDADKLDEAQEICSWCEVKVHCAMYRQTHSKVQKRYGVFAGIPPQRSTPKRKAGDLQSPEV